MNFHLEINWITVWKIGILILQVLPLVFNYFNYRFNYCWTEFTHIPLDIYPCELAVTKIISTKCYLYLHGTGNLSGFIFKCQKLKLKNLKLFLCAQYNTSSS